MKKQSYIFTSYWEDEWIHKFNESSFVEGVLQGYRKSWYTDGLLFLHCCCKDGFDHGVKIEFSHETSLHLRMDYLKNFRG